MAVLKEHLTAAQQNVVTAAAERIGTYEGYNVREMILFMLRTGVHPSVLANKARSNLKVTEDGHVQWSRPKKRGGHAITRVKVSKDIEPWVREFVLQEFPKYREWYWGLCKKVGREAGVPELSPMSLRHTFGTNLDELGFSPAEICSMMNASLPVVVKRYCKRQERSIDEKLDKMGW